MIKPITESAADDAVERFLNLPIFLAQKAGKGAGIRVKIWNDGRVSVIMYRFTKRQVRKYCLLDDGTWHLLREMEEQTFLTDVTRQADMVGDPAFS